MPLFDLCKSQATAEYIFAELYLSYVAARVRTRFSDRSESLI